MDPAYQADPYPIFADLRRDTPVFYSPEYNLWVVTRYADVTTALKQTETFSSVGSLHSSIDFPPSVAAFLAAHDLDTAPLMVESDEPVHTRMRRVINKAFTPQQISKLEPQVRAITDALIDAFVADGQTDFVSQFALPLPGRVICDLFGLPHEDFAQIKRWSDEWLELLGATSPEERLMECAQSFAASQQYFLDQLRERQQHPRDDLLTVMLPEAVGGTAALSMAEAAYNALDFVVAGYETTTNLLGSFLVHLLAHPDQLARLREHPEHIPHAVEELLRLDTSVMGLFRITKRPVELSGVTIPEKARVWLMYSAANHDATQFPHPERLDTTRANAREHVTFGRGIHACIGAPLARLELRIALERLLARLPNLRLVEDALVQRLEHFWLRGYTALPIAWDVR
jgi:cytochrome P450